MRLVLCFLLALATVSPLAQAQKQAEIDKMTDQLLAVTSELSRHHSNISEMLVGIPDRQYSSALLAESTIDKTIDVYGTAGLLSQVASVMLDSRDYQRVLRYLKSHCGYAKRIGAHAVTRINSTLVKVTSTALIAELSKARDLIQALDGTPVCA